MIYVISITWLYQIKHVGSYMSVCASFSVSLSLNQKLYHQERVWYTAVLERSQPKPSFALGFLHPTSNKQFDFSSLQGYCKTMENHRKKICSWSKIFITKDSSMKKHIALPKNALNKKTWPCTTLFSWRTLWLIPVQQEAVLGWASSQLLCSHQCLGPSEKWKSCQVQWPINKWFVVVGLVAVSRWKNLNVRSHFHIIPKWTENK